MPEEFFFLLLELGMGIYFGIIPATLNRLAHCDKVDLHHQPPYLYRMVLQFSVDNKFGHTQKPTDEDGGNFHADHHLLHVKNFGIYNCLMDMYFYTRSKQIKSAQGPLKNYQFQICNAL